MRRLLDRLVDSQEQERKVVAKDIHDGLLQCIVAAEMRLECFESSLPGGLPQLDDLESGLDLLRSAIAEGRRIISDLRPSTLDDFGLVAALRCHLARLEKQTGWAFSFKEELGEQPLPPSVETAIFRIVQDALSPAQSDPQCRRVAVSLGRSNGHVRLRVRDWGQGLDPQATSSSGLELSTVQERASLLDGWCEIESEPGLGTTVEVGIPLAPQGSRADLESCLTALEPAAAGAL